MRESLLKKRTRLIIPAFGTGNWGLPTEEVAQAIFGTVDTFLKSNSFTSLNELTVAINPSDTRMYQVW